MSTAIAQMEKVLQEYFESWQNQDSEQLCSLFTLDGIYRVKPFGIEEYMGREKIKSYWDANPVAKQINPRPKLLTSAFGNNICFAEWENTSTTPEGITKTTRGILLLEFEGELIKELREHYLSQ